MEPRSIIMTSEMPTEKLISTLQKCRACDSGDLFSALDLGELPIANELLKDPVTTDLFPLHLYICKTCGMGQVPNVVSPTRLFSDYRYLSSVSVTFLNHASKYANDVLRRFDWKSDDWILEIASNDGYLLKNFVDRGIRVLGIEPAENIAQRALDSGIPTLNTFFGSEMASKLLHERGYPRLIIANNVYAHVPDIQDFTLGLSTLMDGRTVVSIENPSIMNLINDMQFDSIYHEHYSYLSVNSVQRLVNRFGIQLFDIELIPTHGGSNRYWLAKEASSNESVDKVLFNEISGGLFLEETWAEFASKVSKILNSFRGFVHDCRLRNEVVIGYGAAAKASTLVNASHIEKGEISFIIDESPEKTGRFMPNLGIPIVGLDSIKKVNPSKIVIFPWNLADEIVSKIDKFATAELQAWVAIPELRRVR